MNGTPFPLALLGLLTASMGKCALCAFEVLLRWQFTLPRLRLLTV
jgi:hypothetical protein